MGQPLIRERADGDLVMNASAFARWLHELDAASVAQMPANLRQRSDKFRARVEAQLKIAQLQGRADDVQAAVEAAVDMPRLEQLIALGDAAGAIDLVLADSATT